MKNLSYQNKDISNYFSKNRIKFSDFYRSEKKIILKHIKNNKNIFDIGCGCGGLGLALQEKFKNIHYEGIEMNKYAARYGIKNFAGKNLTIYNNDFLKFNVLKELKFKSYDYIFSLSCIDWQYNFHKSFIKAINLLNKSSKLIISLRLTKKSSINDINNSFQYINYSNLKKGDRAPYVVLNALEFIDFIDAYNIHINDLYGYYGLPSKTAVTPFKKIFFVVAVLKLGKKPLIKNLMKLTNNFYNK